MNEWFSQGGYFCGKTGQSGKWVLRTTARETGFLCNFIPLKLEKMFSDLKKIKKSNYCGKFEPDC